MTTSRIVPWDASQAWRTRARSRQVGLSGKEHLDSAPGPTTETRRAGHAGAHPVDPQLSADDATRPRRPESSEKDGRA
jgi:hypothetical protein